MSQSINLANVDTARFNGSNLSAINLNGARIWTSLPSSTLRAGLHSIRDDKIFGDHDIAGFHRNLSNIGSISPNPLNGFTVWALVEEYSFGSIRTLGVMVNGVHPKNAFDYLEVNGNRFYTSQTGGGVNSIDTGGSILGAVGEDGYDVTTSNLTRWEWGYPSSTQILTNGADHTVKIG